MRLILAMIIMLTATLIASGVPETKTMGPYNVSFDLNTTTNYSILYAKPIQTPVSTTYMMMIKMNNSTLANLAVIENKNLSDSTLALGKLQAEKGLISNGYSRNISSINAVIDGNKGFISGGVNSREMILFMIGYWLDTKDCDCGPVSVGKTKVEMISSYPPELTWSLLSSLHVEKAKQKIQSQSQKQTNDQQQQPKTLVFAPPKKG
jgi:hypothetical protein